jgi:hypothetical protein
MYLTITLVCLMYVSILIIAVGIIKTEGNMKSKNPTTLNSND